MKRKSVRLKSKLHLKAWKVKLWTVWEHGTWYGGLIHFCNRNAAIMWLKRYGKPGMTYSLENKTCFRSLVRVENGYVYFYNPDYGLMISAESKRTCPYAVRNN